MESSLQNTPVRKERHGTKTRSDPELGATRMQLGDILERRRISPLGEEEIKRCLKDINKAFELDKRSVGFMKLKERILSDQDWIGQRVEKDEKYWEERDYIQELKRELIILSYRDYLIKNVDFCNTPISAFEDDRKIIRGKTIMELSDILKDEEREYDGWKNEEVATRTSGPPLRPYKQLWSEVAIGIRCSLEEVASIIDISATQKKIKERSFEVDEMIFKRRWIPLARKIQEVIWSLETMLPPSRKNEKQVLIFALNQLQSRYFDFVHYEIIEGKVQINSTHLHGYISAQDARLREERKLRDEK